MATKSNGCIVVTHLVQHMCMMIGQTDDLEEWGRRREPTSNRADRPEEGSISIPCRYKYPADTNWYS